jgi:hypothetical protein
MLSHTQTRKFNGNKIFSTSISAGREIPPNPSLGNSRSGNGDWIPTDILTSNTPAAKERHDNLNKEIRFEHQ